MATKVKTLPKVILGLALFAGLFFGIRHFLPEDAATSTDGSTPVSNLFGGKTSSDPSAPLGTPSNPIKIGINSFHGFAPGLVANGTSMTTKPGSIFANKGVFVEFVVQDDYPTLATIFTSKSASCSWRTSDFWAQEHPNLRNSGLDARGIMVVDNTQGADAIVTRDPSVRSVEDLAGKSVALLQYTPGHGLLTYALNNSSLSGRKKESVKKVFINADEGATGVRAALVGGHVEAAVIWDPDLSMILKSVPGSHVIYSTKMATNLIFDIMVCDKALLDNPVNQTAFQNLVAGWMEGVDLVRSNRKLAVDAIVNLLEYYQLLVKDQGRDFVSGLFDNLLLTNLADNIRILGLSGGTNHYERVYKDFDIIYREAGALANPNSPVINPSESFDYRFIRNLMAASPDARTEADKPVATFTAVEAQKVQSVTSAALTKPVYVNFGFNEFHLTARAKDILDKEVAPVVETYGTAYFEISGNTDSTGSRAVNLRISQARAQAVVDYLVSEWEFPRERFIVKGNGPDKPLCDESSPEGSLEECRAANRTTRIAVLAR